MAEEKSPAIRVVLFEPALDMDNKISAIYCVGMSGSSAEFLSSGGDEASLLARFAASFGDAKRVVFIVADEKLGLFHAFLERVREHRIPFKQALFYCLRGWIESHAMKMAATTPADEKIQICSYRTEHEMAKEYRVSERDLKSTEADPGASMSLSLVNLRKARLGLLGLCFSKSHSAVAIKMPSAKSTKPGKQERVFAVAINMSRKTMDEEGILTEFTRTDADKELAASLSGNIRLIVNALQVEIKRDVSTNVILPEPADLELSDEMHSTPFNLSHLSTGDRSREILARVRRQLEDGEKKEQIGIMPLVSDDAWLGHLRSLAETHKVPSPVAVRQMRSMTAVGGKPMKASFVLKESGFTSEISALFGDTIDAADSLFV